MATARPVRVLLAFLLAATTLALGACMKPDKAVVAFLLASTQADRWEKVDEPTFRTYLDEACNGCDYLTYNAQQDADVQADQFEQAKKDGADVIVLNAVDQEAAAALVAGETIPVIAYDRFVEGADHYVSVDPAVTGRLMAESLVDRVGARAKVLVLNGATGDANAAALRAAAQEVFERHRVDVLDELTPDTWSSEAAEKWVKEKKSLVTRADAVLAANDNQAAGVAAALDDLGVKGKDYPFITGQDAELDAVQRIVTGRQGMTVHKHIGDMARRAADLAIDVMGSEEPDDLIDYRGVPSVILEPSAVTRSTIAEVLVRDGTYGVSDICTDDVLDDCESLALL